MGKKHQDWRKLVGSPTSTAGHVDQPVTPIIRTYPIGKVEARYTELGNYHGAHVFNYRELVALMKKIERVHETNTSSRIVYGHTAIYATVRGLETPQELRVRLRARRVALKQRQRDARDSLVRAEEKALVAARELTKIQPLLARKPAARKRKPK